jgi:hypothetical protein
MVDVSLMKKDLDKQRLELIELRDWIGENLELCGGKITDTGYDYLYEQADLVIRVPDGRRVEIAFKVLDNG